MLASGLGHAWWKEAVQAYCYLRNVHDLVNGNKTPYELRFGQAFHGRILPFGCSVQYKPSSEKEYRMLQKFGPTTRLDIFAGYHVHNGGKWSGDYLVIDAEALTSSDSQYRAYVHRVKEVIQHGAFIFPMKEGTLRHEDPKDQERHITEANTVLGKETDVVARLPEDICYGGQSYYDMPIDDQCRHDADAWEIRGNYIARIHNVPRTNLFTPLEAEDPPPVSIDKTDLMRTTKTDLEHVDEMLIEDCWDGKKSIRYQTSISRVGWRNTI